ncbi:MAG: hypothetical protein ACOCXZ_01430 [Chloroflexota bacterium]
MDMETLYAQMERLSAGQLKDVQSFIKRMPYKREGRPPTAEEREKVIAYIQQAIAAAEEDDNPGLRRLREEGYLGD